MEHVTRQEEKLTAGHAMSAFRSKLHPVVTAPPQEQVAGSVNPLLQ